MNWGCAVCRLGVAGRKCRSSRSFGRLLLFISTTSMLILPHHLPCSNGLGGLLRMVWWNRSSSSQIYYSDHNDALYTNQVILIGRFLCEGVWGGSRESSQNQEPFYSQELLSNQKIIVVLLFHLILFFLEDLPKK